MNEYQEAYCDLKSALHKIKQNGYCVISNILDQDEITKARDGLWSTLEFLTQDLNKPIDRNDNKTWATYYQMDSNRDLIIQNWMIGHSQFVWDIRQNPKVVNVFAELWKVNQDDLITSFDAISFHIPPEITGKGFYNGEDWWHTDQAPNNNVFSCIQGMVLLYDVYPGDATIRIFKKSNQLHRDIFANNKIKSNKNWYQFKNNDFNLLNTCEKTRVVAKAGDIILWDSRTAHYGILPLKDRLHPNLRANVYVCMTPKNLIDSDNLKKKQQGFNDMLMTTHWPHKVNFFKKYTKKYEVVPDIRKLPKPKLSTLGYKLAGF